MTRRLIPLFIALLFLFPSCSSYDFKRAYDSGQYESVIEMSGSDEKYIYSSVAQGYRMLSAYQLEDVDTAVDAAKMYVMLSEQTSEFRRNALRILLFFSDDKYAILAGEELRETSVLSEDENVCYFTALMDDGRYDEASRLYNEIRGSLSAKSAAQMLLKTSASSSLIVSNLQQWYAEEGLSDELVDTVISTISLLNTRGEGSLILQLALDIDDGNTPRLSLAIGDLYYSLGYVQVARQYWNKARSAFPSLVDRKFNSL